VARDQAVSTRARTTRRLIVAALAAAALGALAALIVTATRAPSPRRLLVGVDDDTLKWTTRPLSVVAAQRRMGADAVRVWVPWHGEARPGRVRGDELTRAGLAAQHTVVVLAVFGFARDSPVTTAAQRRFCSYAGAVLARVRSARAVVVWDEANSPTYWDGSAAEYESLLARCYDVLHARVPGVTVLDSTASAHAPAAFLRRLGAAYRASGRTRPIVDAFGHNPYPADPHETAGTRHVAGFVGEGDYPLLESTLAAAFAGTPQRSRDVWYLEDGYQSAVPVALARRYDGHETAVTLPPRFQSEQVRAAILLAACQPDVRAFFNFELVDEHRLAGWQSGLEWRGAHRKPAAAAFASAARAAASGAVHCRNGG
jgi:hypothetical protein